MTDPIEEKAEGKQVVILIHGGDARAHTLYHRLALLAAVQVIMVAPDQTPDRTGDDSDILKKFMEDPRQNDILRLTRRDICEVPALAALPDIRHDYNARAAYEPRKQDQAMMVKSRDARNHAARTHRGWHYRF